MSDSIRVLCVDADPEVADATATALEREDDRLAVETASNVGDGLDLLKTAPFECVVSEYDLPDRTGIEFLELVRERHPAVPFVLFTDSGSERIASAAISAGVCEYLSKDGSTQQYEDLATRIEAAVDAATVETQLHRSRELLRQTEKLADIGGWEADIETGEQRWTHGLFDMHDVDVDEPDEGDVPTMDEYLSLVDSEHEETFRRAVERCIDEGEPYDEEIQITTFEENTRWIRTIGEPIVRDGEVTAIRGAARDVTERKERERKLEELANFQEAIIESANEWINVLDTDGNVVGWNDAAEEISGYAADDVVGHDAIWEWLYPDDEYRGEILGHVDDILQAEKAVRDFETTIRTNGGGERILSWYSRRITGSDGQVIGSVAIARDVTEQKRRIEERERQAAELERQNERLEEFAGIVSHDLRNPLTVAHGSLELAREECDSHYLDDVEYALDRMNVLIADLLTLARKGDSVGDHRPVDLEDLVRACWQSVRTEEASLEVEADATILADRSRLQQLLENLIRNAVEHGGTDVTVTIGELDDETGFYVEDDGPGVPLEDRGRVFDAGYSTADDGTGLGLNIVAQVADAHGWDVGITDGTSGGTRIEITGGEFDG